MKIVCIGLNHKSAPIDIREKLYFSTEQVNEALADLKICFALNMQQNRNLWCM